MNILLKYHIRKEDEKYSLDEKCWMIYPPQNRQVRFTLKSPVQFTLKSSLAIYPPQIAKSNLPSNRLWWFTPI